MDEQALGELIATFPLGILFALIALTIFLLSKGADGMVEAAVSLALKFKLPKIIIGATILSLGTTTPEVFVSVTAAFMGNSSLALGNGVGSIIADTGLIFGVTVLFAAPPIDRWLLNRTGWWQLGSAFLLVAMAWAARFFLPENPILTRPMAVIFLLLLLLYLVMTYRWARLGDNNALASQKKEEEDRILSLAQTVFFLLGGLILVLIASRLLIPATSEVARRFRVPEDVIATTMLALGTSLPELSTAIAAMRKGHPELTVGNVVGADVLNVLFVIGAAAFASPLVIPRNFFHFHFPVMLLLLCSFRLFINLGQRKYFSRWQGLWFLGLYFAYVILQYTK